MLSLDLFDSKYERRLHEGAVDSTIEHLLKPLSLRAAEIRTQIRAGGLTGAELSKLEKEYEDLVQRRMDIMLDRKPQTEQQQPVPVKGQLKGKDLVTPQQRVAGATPPQTSMLGKAKETFSSFANWLAGRDDTGPTYENLQLDEQDPNSAINLAKYVYEQMRRAHDQNVDMATIRWMGTSEPVTMSRNQIYHTLMKLKGMSRQNRNAFALQTLADRNNFYLWLGGQKKITPRPQLKQPTDPFQPELPLGKPQISPVQERDQKKKSNDQEDIKAGDVKVARELQKLRAQYPAARSDVEAVARAEIDSTERSQQQLAAIRGANQKQDALLKQLVALDREQGREIDTLDKENNSLEQQLARIQATNARLQQTVGQMTGTKKAPARAQPLAVPTSATMSDTDPATLKKVQDLETQIQQLRALPSTPQNQEKISNLDTRLSALQAQVGELTPTKPKDIDAFGDLDNTDKPVIKKDKPVPRPQAPIGDLDMAPKKKSKAKSTKSKAPKPVAKDDELDVLEPDLLAVTEHGGGIGPRQHWQSMMKNEGWSDKYNPTPYAVYIDGRQWREFRSDDEARRVADKVRDNLKQQGRNQTVTIAPSEAWLKKESDEQLLEGIKDTAGATAVIACLLVGGSLSGCATAPQQTTTQQVLKTGQDAGRVVMNAKKITRAGTEEEARQELRNILRGMGNRPEELNNSNIIRIWKRIKGQPPVPAEAPAPEYGPAEPVRRPATEAREIHTREDFVRERDRLLRMISQETNPANKQILKSAIRQLENRAENEGWLTIQQRMIREDNASEAAEQAIIKRIMVAHVDLLRQYGPEKVIQAAEEVAYNVGDVAEIGTSDVSAWVHQVKQILGADA